MDGPRGVPVLRLHHLGVLVADLDDPATLGRLGALAVDDDSGFEAGRCDELGEFIQLFIKPGIVKINVYQYDPGVFTTDSVCQINTLMESSRCLPPRPCEAFSRSAREQWSKLHACTPAGSPSS